MKQHPEAYAAVENKTADKRPPSASSQCQKTSSSSIGSIQSKLSQYFGEKTKPYDSNSRKCKDLNSALSFLFASQTLPHLLVESQEFKYFVQLLDPKYELPNRRQLSSNISDLYKLLKETILSELKEVQKVCVVLDIWTKKGLSESYLGVLIKYFEPMMAKRRMALIAVQKLDGRHTAQNIFDVLRRVLVNWNITENMVSYYITDNGSNIVKALKECVTEFVPLVIKPNQTGAAFDAAIENERNETEIQDMAIFEEGDINLDASFVENDLDKEISEFDQLESKFSLIDCAVLNVNIFY